MLREEERLKSNDDDIQNNLQVRCSSDAKPMKNYQMVDEKFQMPHDKRF